MLIFFLIFFTGSITDSVCTAYENTTGTGGLGLRRGGQGLAKSVLREESSRENSPRYKEESEQQEPSPQPTSLSNVLDSMCIYRLIMIMGIYKKSRISQKQ